MYERKKKKKSSLIIQNKNKIIIRYYNIDAIYNILVIIRNDFKNKNAMTMSKKETLNKKKKKKVTPV